MCFLSHSQYSELQCKCGPRGSTLSDENGIWAICSTSQDRTGHTVQSHLRWSDFFHTYSSSCDNKKGADKKGAVCCRRQEQSAGFGLPVGFDVTPHPQALPGPVALPTILYHKGSAQRCLRLLRLPAAADVPAEMRWDHACGHHCACAPEELLRA